MKKCPSCGFEQSPENSRFCIRCGTPLSGEQPANPGDAQPGQSAGPAAAPAQRAGSAPGAIPSAPSVSRPSPYAALPHIPSSAKGGRMSQRDKGNELLRGLGLIFVFILCTVGLFAYSLSGPEFLDTKRPSSSWSGAASPTSSKPSWDFEIVEINMEKSADGSIVYVFGELELHSSSTVMNGSVTVELYDQNDRFLRDCTSNVLVCGSKIEFRIPCSIHPSQMQNVDYFNVILQLSDGL